MDVIFMRKDIALAAHGRLVVSSIAARLTVDLVDLMLDGAIEHRRRHGSDSISLTLIKPHVALPDEATRAHIKIVNKRPDSAQTSVVVIDAVGFWAAAMRGILAGMSLASPKAPAGAATIAEAIAKLTPKLAECGDLRELEREIAAFRAKHLAMV